jgi:hypothetical protein
MAETTLTVNNIDTSGIDQPATLAAANADGSKWVGSGREFLMVENGSGGEITVTVAGQKNCNLGFSHNIAVAIPAGEGKSIGPFAPAIYEDGDGDVHVTYSAVTTVTVAVFKLT